MNLREVVEWSLQSAENEPKRGVTHAWYDDAFAWLQSLLPQLLESHQLSDDTNIFTLTACGSFCNGVHVCILPHFHTGAPTHYLLGSAALCGCFENDTVSFCRICTGLAAAKAAQTISEFAPHYCSLLQC